MYIRTDPYTAYRTAANTDPKSHGDMDGQIQLLYSCIHRIIYTYTRTDMITACTVDGVHRVRGYGDIQGRNVLLMDTADHVGRYWMD